MQIDRRISRINFRFRNFADEFEGCSAVETEAPHFVGSFGKRFPSKHYAGGLANIERRWTLTRRRRPFTPPIGTTTLSGTWIPELRGYDYDGGQLSRWSVAIVQSVTDASGNLSFEELILNQSKAARPYNAQVFRAGCQSKYLISTNLLVHRRRIYTSE